MADTLDQQFDKVFASLPVEDQKRLKTKWRREREREARVEVRNKVKQAALSAQMLKLEEKINLLYAELARLEGLRQTPAIQKQSAATKAKQRRLQKREAALMQQCFDLVWGRKLKRWEATKKKAEKLLGQTQTRVDPSPRQGPVG